MADLSKLAIHTMTNKPWTLGECIEQYRAAGVAAISVWRNVLEPVGTDEAARMLADSGLAVPALVRGGFFPASDPADRQKAIDENRRCIDEAAALSAQMVVLVVGAVPGVDLAEARKQVTEGIAACLPHARERNVKLAIEPLHPMYAAQRSCINRMVEARDICQQLNDSHLGIAVDVYHTWWDPDLQAEIAIAGEQGWLLAFHVCDWRTETRSLLTDRGLMGEGCIDIPKIRGWMEAAGFDGYNEVEIFSDAYWAMDQGEYLAKIKDAYLKHV
jgi:sugar phosphate isomerase/epimerase